MATTALGSFSSSSSSSKSSKWFFNKSLKLSLPRRRKPDGSLPSPMFTSRFSSSSSPSPRSPARSLSTLPSPARRFPRRSTSTSRAGELQQVFRHFDADGDGKISSLELKSYFASIGENMSIDQAQGVINDLDMDGDGLMDFDEFTRLIEKETIDEDIRTAFEMFEADKGSGCITPKSLQRMLNRLGDDKSQEECEAMIRVYDLDENGMLDFHEFHQMLT